MALAEYRNCGESHRSNSYIYLARQTRSGPPIEEQLKAFRNAGDRERLAIF